MSVQQAEAFFGKPLSLLFKEANKSGSGSISPMEAKAYFPKFQVPQQMLKNIWFQFAPPPANAMSYQGFEGAMMAIFQFKTSNTGPTPSPGLSTNSILAPTPLLAATPASTGNPQNNARDPTSLAPMSMEEKQKYSGFFRQIQVNNLVNQQSGIPFFMKSGLDRDSIISIWKQFDSGNGSLNLEQFCKMMQFVMIQKRSGNIQSAPQNATQMQQMPMQSMQPLQPMQSIQPLPSMLPLQTLQPMSPPVSQMIPHMNPQANIQQAEARIGRLQEETKALGKQRFDVDGENSRLALKLQELQSREKSLQEAIQNQRNEIQSFESQRDIMQQQIHQFNQQIEQGNMERSQIMNQLTNVRQEAFRLENILNTLKTQKDQVFSERSHALSELEQGTERLRKLKEQISDIQNQSLTKERDISQAEKEVVSKFKEIEENQQTLHQLRVSLDETNSKLFEFETKKRVFSEANNRLVEQIQSIKTKKEDLNRKLKQFEQESKTKDSQSPQIIRLSHIIRTAENLLQNASDILNDRTVNINIVSIEPAISHLDFSIPEKLSSIGSGKSYSANSSNHPNGNLNSFTSTQNDLSTNVEKKLPPVPLVSKSKSPGTHSVNQSNSPSENPSTSTKDPLDLFAPRKDEPSKDSNFGFDDFSGFGTESKAPSISPNASSVPNVSPNQGGSELVFDDFFGGAPSNPAENSSTFSGSQGVSSNHGFGDDWDAW